MPATPPNEESIFAQALGKRSPLERAAFLDATCGEDTALRARIEKLVRRHEEGESFLAKPLGATLAQELISERPGSVIGPYKLKELIGEGGMGLVFVAEQREPVRRKVALKVIKPGMDTRDVIARFEAERQALALMDHPNIARVLDAGATDSGRPYFVMELVKGIPITDYCDEHALTPRERLQLFISVCQAVQHAHQKGVIHRDLKPSNVLVAPHDGTPVVKVIDFGVAKAISQPLTDKSIYTRLSQMIGTPMYMSPEQAEINALDVDTRSDIYGLGVLLYELLTGTTPFDRQRLQTAAFDEMRRIIREEEPPRPSTRLTTLGEGLSVTSAKRKTEPAKLSALFKGELDWIVMKALEKDRTRRYETASALAADVRRFMSEEPIEARPPSAWYRFRKMARRNKAAMTTAALVAGALLAGTAVSIWQAVRATRAEDAALIAEVRAVAARDKEAQQRLAAENERNRATIAEADAWKSAEKAEANAALAELERQKARASETEAKTLLYASHIASAQREWERSDVPLFYHFLEKSRQDFRGWEHDYLYTLANRNLQTLRVDTDQAYDVFPSVAFSPDGKRLATNSWGVNEQGRLSGELKLWDLTTGRERLTHKAPSAYASGVAFSPDGKYLASTSGDTLKLFDAASGKDIWKLQTRGVSHVAFSPDGKYLAGAVGVRPNPNTGLGKVTLWDAANGRELLTLEGHANVVRCVAFSPDGRRLASASGDATVKLWELASGKDYLTFSEHTFGVRSVAFSPDGKHLASSAGSPGPGSRGEVKVWDAMSGKEVWAHNGNSFRVESVAFTPDGQRLAGASDDRTVKVWDAASGRVLQTFLGHKKAVYSVAFSPDGKRLASASFDKTVKLWDADSVQEGLGVTLRGHGGPVHGIAFSRNGKDLASAGVIRLKSGNQGVQPGELKLWDAASGKQLRTFEGHAGPVWSVAFSPNGKHLASAGGVGLNKPGEVKLWDAASGKQLLTFQGHDEGVLSVAFGPDGKHLATGSRDQTVKLWDAASGRELQTFLGHKDDVTCVAFSPDGRRLASASPEMTVKVWDVDSGKGLLSFRGPKLKDSRGLSVAFSPDGKRLAATAYDTVKLWDATTGEELLPLQGHTGRVTSVAFSPDGKRLATGSADNTVKLWDAASGVEVLTLRHESGITRVAFSPDGKHLACAGQDGTIIIYDASKSMKELEPK
jgi:WD40 repeat protein/serine/threonine protein kinase